MYFDPPPISSPHTGRQWWRKHWQLSVLSASFHDPLAQRGRVQRHHRRPEKVGTPELSNPKSALMLSMDGSFFVCVCPAENRPTCTTSLRGRTRPSWPSTGRSRLISTRLRSFWRRCSALQSNPTLIMLIMLFAGFQCWNFRKSFSPIKRQMCATWRLIEEF